MAVVVSISFCSAEAVVWTIIASRNDLIDLALGFFIVQIVDLFAAGVCIGKIPLTVHVSFVTSHFFFRFCWGYVESMTTIPG